MTRKYDQRPGIQRKHPWLTFTEQLDPALGPGGAQSELPYVVAGELEKTSAANDISRGRQSHGEVEGDRRTLLVLPDVACGLQELEKAFVELLRLGLDDYSAQLQQ